MKVLKEAQGARGWCPDSRANQTTPHHTVPYHARAFLPSLTRRHSASYLVCNHRPSQSIIPKPAHQIQTNTKVRLDLKKST